jgi:hypothetical protein
MDQRLFDVRHGIFRGCAELLKLVDAVAQKLQVQPRARNIFTRQTDAQLLDLQLDAVHPIARQAGLLRRGNRHAKHANKKKHQADDEKSFIASHNGLRLSGGPYRDFVPPLVLALLPGCYHGRRHGRPASHQLRRTAVTSTRDRSGRAVDRPTLVPSSSAPTSVFSRSTRRCEDVPSLAGAGITAARFSRQTSSITRNKR